MSETPGQSGGWEPPEGATPGGGWQSSWQPPQDPPPQQTQWGQPGNVQFQPLQRFATEDRVVDDSIVTFEVVKDGYWPHFSAGQKIEMRLVHIFEMRDGKISKEIVFDMGRPVEGEVGLPTTRSN